MLSSMIKMLCRLLNYHNFFCRRGLFLLLMIGISTLAAQDTLWYSNLEELMGQKLNTKITGKYLGRSGGQQGESTVIRKNGRAFIPVSFQADECCYWKGFNINKIGPEDGFKAVDSLYWRYKISFDKQFDFRWGGKIGWAMCAADIPGNGRVPGLGSFSITLMWRTHERNSRNEEAFVDIYIYYAGQKGAYPKGGRIERAILKKGEFYDFEFWLNRANATLEVRMDGKTIMYKRNFVFAVEPFRWNLQLNNFFGGSNPVDWAPRERSVFYVGDLLVLDNKPLDW